MKKSVALIRPSHGRMAMNPGDYNSQIELMKSELEREQNREGEAIFDVETFHEIDKALRWLKNSFFQDRILVFFSYSEIGLAKDALEKEKGLKVVVLTALIPDNQVRIVDKSWIHGDGMARFLS